MCGCYNQRKDLVWRCYFFVRSLQGQLANTFSQRGAASVLAVMADTRGKSIQLVMVVSLAVRNLYVPSPRARQSAGLAELHGRDVLPLVPVIELDLSDSIEPMPQCHGEHARRFNKKMYPL